MKKDFTIIIILTLTIFIISSCKKENNINSSYYNKQLLLIDNLYININKRLDYLYKIDTSLFAERKCRLNEIRLDFTNLRNKVSSTITDKDIHNIKVKLTEIGITGIDMTYYVSLLKMDNLNFNEKLLNLNFLELLFLEFYNDFYSHLFYNAFRIEPIIVPQKNPIRLGEEYKCDIYLASVNGFNFIGKVDNKVLENEGEIPVFKIKPKTKGKKEIKGELGLKWDIMSRDTFFLPFTISIDVQ